MHILVVEDERRLANLIRRALEEEGHVVDVSHDGAEGLDMAEGTQYDLLVLDLMLPHLDGVELCRRLRAGGNDARVLMLTARDAVEDRVQGLEAGADDYLIKPFSFSELMARVKALSRRQVQAQPEEELVSGDLTLDLQRREARRGQDAIELTAKEFQLLEYLMRNAGHVLTRTQILDHVWGYNFDSFSNVVDIYVHYLRNKIDRGYSEPLIRTVRGVGYSLKAS
ncbi:MAG TPA: DNA-binding response regulator [Chloroflexi bacterium]|jgi:DNA-binding response OmpR family regulator|nr:DNA-binding response regulator [Chloroflexota bacterium]